MTQFCILLAQYLTLENEHFYTDQAVGGFGFCKAIVDVRSQGMQGNPALFVPFRPGHLGTTQSSGTDNFDTLCAESHGRRHTSFHGPSEGNPTLNLQGNVFSHKLRIDLRFSNFLNIDENFLGNQRFQIPLELLYFRTFFPNHYPGPGSKYAQAYTLGRSFDFYAGDTCMVQFLLDEFSDFMIFEDIIRIFLPGIPSGIPCFDDP